MSAEKARKHPTVVLKSKHARRQHAKKLLIASSTLHLRQTWNPCGCPTSHGLALPCGTQLCRVTQNCRRLLLTDNLKDHCFVLWVAPCFCQGLIALEWQCTRMSADKPQLGTLDGGRLTGTMNTTKTHMPEVAGSRDVQQTLFCGKAYVLSIAEGRSRCVAWEARVHVLPRCTGSRLAPGLGIILQISM